MQNRLPQVCFSLQTRSIQTQTDLITIVTIERFNDILDSVGFLGFQKLLRLLREGMVI